MKTSVKTLRASGRTLQADVILGQTKGGSPVTVKVTVNPHDEDVAAALKPLLELLQVKATTLVSGAMDELEIATQVRARVAKERDRLERTATERVQARVTQLERSLVDAERALERTKDALSDERIENRRLRAQQQLDGQASGE